MIGPVPTSTWIESRIFDKPGSLLWSVKVTELACWLTSPRKPPMWSPGPESREFPR